MQKILNEDRNMIHAINKMFVCMAIHLMEEERENQEGDIAKHAYLKENGLDDQLV